jgi:hypothetical protein
LFLARLHLILPSARVHEVSQHGVALPEEAIILLTEDLFVVQKVTA